MTQLDGTLETVRELLTEELNLFLAILVLLLGLAFGVWMASFVTRWLDRFGVAEAVEGTPFERSARQLGTSTVGILSRLVGLFVFALAVVVALQLLKVVATEIFVTQVTNYFPNLFIAAIVVVTGLLVGEKAALATSERLRSVKLAEVTLLPSLVKYSIFYIAALVALAQLNVAVLALVVLLAAYAFGVFFIGGIAFRDLLGSATAGIYLLLTEPYAIGDEVEIDGRRGIVQEVDTFVTRIENDDEEYIIPNRQVFQSGIVRIRR